MWRQRLPKFGEILFFPLLYVSRAVFFQNARVCLGTLPRVPRGCEKNRPRYIRRFMRLSDFFPTIADFSEAASRIST